VYTDLRDLVGSSQSLEGIKETVMKVVERKEKSGMDELPGEIVFAGW